MRFFCLAPERGRGAMCDLPTSNQRWHRKPRHLSIDSWADGSLRGKAVAFAPSAKPCAQSFAAARLWWFHRDMGAPEFERNISPGWAWPEPLSHPRLLRPPYWMARSTYQKSVARQWQKTNSSRPSTQPWAGDRDALQTPTR